MHGILLILSILLTSPPLSQEDFRNPPPEARPRVWWHWEDGNITKEGIRKDLEWMHRIGIGGLHHFDAGIPQEPVVSERLVYMHDGWKDAFRYALRLCDSLGMTVGIASSPGWSNTGGPWVGRDDAMKKLVWSSLDTDGGHIERKLPEPRSNLNYYRDLKILAMPICPSDSTFRAIKVLGNSGRTVWNIAPYDYNLVLEYSENGRDFREITRIPQTSAGSISVNFAPVMQASGENFRLRDLNGKAAPGFILYSSSRINHSEEKSGFSSPYDLYDFKTVIGEDEAPPQSSSVIELNCFPGRDGTLVCDLPEGRWRILRFGYTLTGKRNGPAPEEATGLEVDKLDRDAYRNYFRTYLNMYREASCGLMGERGVSELLIDSYEAGCQTWTSHMFEEFERRRGYSLVNWLPVLTGEILDSAEASEKFLFDWRLTIGDLYAGSYASVKQTAAEFGIDNIYIESQENGRVLVADGMDMKKSADVPMAACWVTPDCPTLHSTEAISVADMRESASVAHIYGQRWVAAESFTCDGLESEAYSFTPEKLKRLADLEFSCGINRIFIHESSHQPLDDCRPGLGLLQYGQWFNRHETWAELAGAWTDYLARSCHMLSLGRNVADILVYYGEDTNVTAKYGKCSFPVPKGLNYDFISPAGLYDLKVENGLIIAPSGACYRLLCLDSALTPQSDGIKSRLRELKDLGANICDINDLAARAALIPKDLSASANLRFVHRTAGSSEIYWVNNPTDRALSETVSFRCPWGNPMIFNPESGEMTSVRYSRKSGRTLVKLNLNPDDAVFVVFSKSPIVRKSPSPHTRNTAWNSPRHTIGLSEWELSFPFLSLRTDSLKSYTLSGNKDIRYFSGSCIYSTRVTLEKSSSNAILDLGEVHDLCRVHINGQDLGILWRAPFRLKVGETLKKGSNLIEIEVVNSWVNRLIGDCQPDCNARTTYTTTDFFNPSSPLREAGLTGPVNLIM